MNRTEQISNEEAYRRLKELTAKSYCMREAAKELSKETGADYHYLYWFSRNKTFDPKGLVRMSAESLAERERPSRREAIMAQRSRGEQND